MTVSSLARCACWPPTPASCRGPARQGQGRPALRRTDTRAARAPAAGRWQRPARRSRRGGPGLPDARARARSRRGRPPTVAPAVATALLDRVQGRGPEHRRHVVDEDRVPEDFSEPRLEGFVRRPPPRAAAGVVAELVLLHAKA